MASNVVEMPLPDDVQPRPAPDQEMGVTLDLPFGTFNGELFNPAEVDIPDLLSRIDLMLRTDGHFRALARLLSLPFRRAKWSMEPDEDGDEEADFLTQMLTRPPYQGGMSTSFDYVRALASKAMWQGYAVWEQVYTYADIPGHGTKLVLRKLAPREARTVRFKADPHGGFAGIVQRASDGVNGQKEVHIPPEKVLFFVVDKEEHPFYGRSMFEPALYHFDKKHKLYYIAHIAAQQAAVPARIAYQEGGGTQELTTGKRTQLERALASFGFNTAMIPPRGIKIEPFGGKGDAAIREILEVINHHNVQASQSILAQFIDLGQGGENATGSYALSKDSSDLFLMCSQTLLDSFAETFNTHLIPKFIDWNFGSGKYPKLVFEPLADETKQAMAEVFQALSVASTTNVSPDFIWELEKRVADQLGLPIDYDALDAEREAQMEQDALVAETLATLQGGGIGVEPGADLDPEEVPLGDDPEVVFLADDCEPVELIDLADARFTKSDRAKEESRQRRQRESRKRDKMGQFSRINEVGTGAGMGTQGNLAPVTTDIQRRLAKLGYDLGTFGASGDGIDGKYGKVTAAAVKKFQADNGLPVTGRVDMGTYAMLLELAPTASKPKKKTAKKAKAKKKAPSGAAKNLADATKRLADLRKPKTSDED